MSDRSTALGMRVCFLSFLVAALLFVPASSQSFGPLAGNQGGSESIPLSSGVFGSFLPAFPNLEMGFIYSFGNNVGTSRFEADYLAPFKISGNTIVFGEIHYEAQNFWKQLPGGTDYRMDLSLGGGFRTLMGENAFIGVNGFYDSSRFFGNWYSSQGLGFEMALLLGSDAAFDFNLNSYGNLLSSSGIINAFRNMGGSYDVEAGYSHSLFGRLLDLRIKGVAYQFDTGSKVYGWKTGVELTTADGLIEVKYELARDAVNGRYDTFGVYANVGFQPENLFSGQNPFSMPEPVFKSPRSLKRMMTRKVHRDWHQATQVVKTSSSPHFVFAPNPPYWDTSSGTYTQSSDSQAIWAIRFNGQTGDDWCGTSGGYTVSLRGDLSAIQFPLTVTITPQNWRPWINRFTVRNESEPVDFLPMVVVMTGPSDTSKLVIITSPNNETPRIHRSVFTGSQIGYQAQIKVSAPGASTLTVDIISSN
jgi:hypothetical protein